MSWERNSDRNIQEAHSKSSPGLGWPGLVLTGNVVTEIKAKSEKLRSEVEHHLATAANTMLTAWNSTNQVNHNPPII